MEYNAIKVNTEDNICMIQLYRPDFRNTINSELVEECLSAINQCEASAKIIIIEGLPEIFCFGADLEKESSEDENSKRQPDLLYELWYKLATGPFISVSHVRGQANAGGVGFVSASDIVIADKTAVFSLSELLFGLYPAMVLPFLIRKIGFQRANYMTLMTKPISVKTAYEWGLVDIYGEKSNILLKQHLARLSKIPKSGIINYKNYMNQLTHNLSQSRKSAVESNVNMFSNEENLARIQQFVDYGKYPWE